MNFLRTILIPVLILAAEAVLTVGLFFFATKFKLFYVLFALLLLLATLAYLFYNRYRETIKIKPREEVLARYRKIALRVLIIVGGIFLVLIVGRALVYLIFQ